MKDREFMRLPPLIERAAFDERNFVKKAVNWALRNIGKRNLALNRAALAHAERMRDRANRRAGGERGGDPAARSARWVASDALRELSSAKVQARLQVRRARTPKASQATFVRHQRRRTEALERLAKSRCAPPDSRTMGPSLGA